MLALLLLALDVQLVVPMDPATVDLLTPLPAFGEACGYESCPVTVNDKLNVHVVPHTYAAFGYKASFYTYYTGVGTFYPGSKTVNMKRILDFTITQLWEKKQRRFTLGDLPYFFHWWSQRDGTVRRMVYELIRQGRLTLVGGGRGMADEATTSYHAIIEHFTYALRKVNATFLECGRPLVAWQADVYGHSREFASLAAQMGFDGLFVNPISFEDELSRMQRQGLEMLWRGSDDLGAQTDIYTHKLFDGYWSPPGFCFSKACGDQLLVTSDSLLSNAKERVNAFIDSMLNRQAPNYNTNQIMVMMGAQFAYYDAPLWFTNVEKLIDMVNIEGSRSNKSIHLMFSTPACYLKAVYEASPALETKQDDFFPVAYDKHTYFSGMYTTRPALKLLAREGLVFMQMAKQLQVLARLSNYDKVFEEFMWIFGVFQDHRIMAGDMRYHVKSYYVARLFAAIQRSTLVLKHAFNKVRGSPSATAYYRCALNVSSCTNIDSAAVIMVYNPLSWPVSVPVRLPVVERPYLVYDPTGQPVKASITPISDHVLRIPLRKTAATQDIVFIADKVPPLGYRSYFIEQVSRTRRSIIKKIKKPTNKKYYIQQTHPVKTDERTFGAIDSDYEDFEDDEETPQSVMIRSIGTSNDMEGSTVKARYGDVGDTRPTLETKASYKKATSNTKRQNDKIHETKGVIKTLLSADSETMEGDGVVDPIGISQRATESMENADNTTNEAEQKTTDGNDDYVDEHAIEVSEKPRSTIDLTSAKELKSTEENYQKMAELEKTTESVQDLMNFGTPEQEVNDFKEDVDVTTDNTDIAMENVVGLNGAVYSNDKSNIKDIVKETIVSKYVSPEDLESSDKRYQSTHSLETTTETDEFNIENGDTATKSDEITIKTHERTTKTDENTANIGTGMLDTMEIVEITTATPGIASEDSVQFGDGRRKNSHDVSTDNFIENKYIRLNLEPTSRKVSSLNLSNGVSITLDIQLYYYASDDPAALRKEGVRPPGAYVFRAMDNAPVPILDYLDIKVYKSELVQEYRCEFAAYASLAMRVYAHSPAVELEWLVGPIPDDDDIGKDVFIRYRTDLAHGGVLYTDSNGRQTVRRIRGRRPMYDHVNRDPAAGNIYPVTSKIYIEDVQRSIRFSVMPDRAQGGTSVFEGELDLMLHRRILTAEDNDILTFVNDTEADQGEMIRGKHYIYLSKADYKPHKIFEKKLAKEIELQPQILLSKNLPYGLTSRDIWITHKNEMSFLKTKLPVGIHVLTIEKWNDGTLLLRIENYLEKADAVRSGIKKVCLNQLFTNIYIKTCKETTLAANIWLEDFARLRWKHKGKFIKSFNEFYATGKKVQFGDDELKVEGFGSDLCVTLTPQQIRTFVCVFDYV